MIGTVLGVTLNLISTIFFQFVLIRETKFNDVADSYYLALAFGLFAGSVFTSMVQYTYQRKIIENNGINIGIVHRIKALSYRMIFVNTVVVYFSVFIARTYFGRDYFSAVEVLLICFCGAFQIVSTISVIFAYSLGQKFGPGFSGVYPSIGSSILIFWPSLTTILIGLCIGYVLQILQNFLTSLPFWHKYEKRDLDTLNLAGRTELWMIFQYLLLSCANFMQKLLFSALPSFSVSIFATAEKIAQTGFSILSTGFNQFTFNTEVNLISYRVNRSSLRKSRDIRYLAIVFLILSISLIFLRAAVVEIFSILNVNVKEVDKIMFFLRPMLVGVAFTAVSLLFTNKLYSLGFVKLNAKVGIFNASLMIASQFLLFFVGYFQYIAHIYASLAFLNALIKLFQWYFLMGYKGKFNVKRDSFLEILFILISFFIIILIFLATS